jgi:shikimate dehydrogenase
VCSAQGGGNVTLPHKQETARAIHAPDESVRRTGACNTFWPDGSNGNIAGANTDVAGVLAALDKLAAPPSCWLVVGTGGSARAVAIAALERGASLAVVSRTPDKKQSFEAWATGCGVRLGDPEQCEVVINATPLGLTPEDALPIVPAQVPNAVVALDLVYSINGTRWSRAMQERGIRAADGREAVVAQGAAAFRCWFPELDPPVEVMRAVVNARLRV